jgi:hypothetical protein
VIASPLEGPAAATAPQPALTRFPLFFGEERAFFLEGADRYDFRLGRTPFFAPGMVPFHSRRIGLFESTQIPVWTGDKTCTGGSAAPA